MTTHHLAARISRSWQGILLLLILLLVTGHPTLPAAEPVTAPAAAENLARGKPYTLFPQPTYSHCTDAGDLQQLTDGKTTSDYFWTQPGTVGWQSARYAAVTIDLGDVQQISGVADHRGRRGRRNLADVRLCTGQRRRSDLLPGRRSGGFGSQQNGPLPRATRSGDWRRTLQTGGGSSNSSSCRCPEDHSSSLTRCKCSRVRRLPPAALAVNPPRPSSCTSRAASAAPSRSDWTWTRGVAKAHRGNGPGRRAVRYFSRPKSPPRCADAEPIVADASFPAVLPLNAAMPQCSACRPHFGKASNCLSCRQVFPCCGSH